jgi:enterochelin esterase-like enzyme
LAAAGALREHPSEISWHNLKALQSTSPTAPDQWKPRAWEPSAPFHDGEEIVLTFRGHADAVHLVTWMPMFPTPPSFTRTADDIWQLRLHLPRTARIEYRLAVTARGRTRQTDDPLNPPIAPNPFGSNSVLTGPGYQTPWYVRTPPEPLRGHLHEIRVTSAALGRRHHYHVYLPEGFKAGSGHPVLMVQDGPDFLEFGDLGGCLDRLIDAGEVASMAVVLLDPWNRIAEYGANPAYSRHLLEEVLPHIVRRLRLKPMRTAALGSSLGAVAALAAAWHHPKALAGIALLSGSFAHTFSEDWPPEVFAPIVEFLKAFEADPRLEDVAVFQSVGRFERLCDLNRRLAPIIGSAAARHVYHETWDGHHWGSWRDRLGDALSFLFPGSARVDGLS